MPAKRPAKTELMDIMSEQVDQLLDQLAGGLFDRPTPKGQGQPAAGQLSADVRAALYAVLCDPDSRLRPLVQQTLGQGLTAAAAVLVPLLASQFKLAPAAATATAALAVQTLANSGQEKLCAELARKPRKRPTAKPKPKPKAKPKAKPKPRPAKPGRPKRPAPRRTSTRSRQP